MKFSQLPLDRLTFYVTGRDDVATRLCELCLAQPLGVLVRGRTGGAGRAWRRPPAGDGHSAGGLCRRRGPAAGQPSLLPRLPAAAGVLRVSRTATASSRSTGWRRACGARRRARRRSCCCSAAAEPTLEGVLDASNLALFCTPAINLFPKRLDRVAGVGATHEFHVVADRTRPAGLRGLRADRRRRARQRLRQRADVRAVLRRHSATHGPTDQLAYYTAAPRAAAAVGEPQKRRGPRSSYIGSEMFLSLVDPAQAPFSGDLRQLAMDALCTNRDLPLQMPQGVKDAEGNDRDLSLDIAAPVAGIRVVSGPSRPYGPLADGAVAWRALNHLSLNYYSLVDATPGGRRGGAARAVAPVRRRPGRRAAASRSRAFVPSASAASCGGCAGPGRWRSAGGWRSRSTVDDMAFEGGSALLLGAVLHAYFARHVSMNAFTETVLRSDGRGEIIDGCHNGARGRRCSVLRASWRRRRTATTSTRRCGGWSVCTPRRPRWGQARRPADEPVRLGQDPELAFAPAPLSSFAATGRTSAAPRRAALRPARAERPDADCTSPSTRASGCATPATHARAASSTCCSTGSSRSSIGRGRRRSRMSTATGPATIASRSSSGRSLGLGAPMRLRRRDHVPGRRQVLPRRGARPPRPERLGARGDPASTTSACRYASRSSSGTGCRSGRASAPTWRAKVRRWARAPCSGRRVWDRQHKFRLRLGPLTLAAVRELPSRRRAAARSSWTGCGSTSGLELEWDVRLQLARAEVPRADPWPAGTAGVDHVARPARTSRADADDLCLNAESFVQQ